MRASIIIHAAQLENCCGKLNSANPEFWNNQSLGFNVAFTSFFPKIFCFFFLETQKYCSRRNVTRIIGKSSTGDEITAAIWCITDVCSTNFFFFFWVFYPSLGQPQTLCLAYEIWQLYSPRLDGWRLGFFLEFTEAPGNRLAGSRMILKGYIPPDSHEEMPLNSLIKN